MSQLDVDSILGNASVPRKCGDGTIYKMAEWAALSDVMMQIRSFKNKHWRVCLVFVCQLCQLATDSTGMGSKRCHVRRSMEQKVGLRSSFGADGFCKIIPFVLKFGPGPHSVNSSKSPPYWLHARGAGAYVLTLHTGVSHVFPRPSPLLQPTSRHNLYRTFRIRAATALHTRPLEPRQERLWL